MQAHIGDSTVVDIIVCCAVCAVASVIIVAFRIWARFEIANRLNAGDYLIITSLVRLFPDAIMPVPATISVRQQRLT